MKIVEKQIIEIIKKLTGRLLFIGSTSDKVISNLNENEKITFCDILSYNESGTGSSSKRKNKKTINIKDFKKNYKKNKLDYIICDMKDMHKLFHRFVPVSIYIGIYKIYIYGNNDIYDMERVIRKYKRYKCKINYESYENNYVVEIDVNGVKNNFFKDKLYYLVDILGVFADYISDLILG